ncbi:MAG TPA: alpha/beta fold hydrolase [Bryobacteraceae bacterium]|nr:alpha/beta fold hydrolase [Bryobacteraceae bacterium]
MSEWENRDVTLDGTTVTLREAGSGPPLLILHDELGPSEWLEYHEALSRDRRLVMPIAPGFRTPRLKWMRSVTDLSRFYGRLLRQESLRPVEVLGFSFGGWVAAEMAVNDPAQFASMTLVAPFGIKPPEGEIFDMYIGTTAEFLKVSVADPEGTPEFERVFGKAGPETIEAWEDARIESAQLAWEPYMHNPSLDHHVRGLDGLPTLVIWGSRDTVLPKSAAQAYADNIPKARLAVIEGSGHRPELERREEFLSVLRSFIGRPAHESRE